MTVEEVEAIIENKGSLVASEAVDGEVFDDESEDQAEADIMEAISLLEEIKTVVDYIKNPNIIKNISKRERDVLGRVSENIRTYLSAAYPTYMEENEEEDS